MSDFSDRDIDATVHQFEAAASARPIDLPKIEVRQVLLALDGSNQDRAVLDLGRATAGRLGAGVFLTYAYEQQGSDPEKDRYLAAQAAALSATGVAARHARSGVGGRAFAQLLELATKENCGLVALPSPYLEDFRDLGGASVGTTTDVLLHRRAVPLLVVRKPAENVRDRLEHVVLPLNLLSSRIAEAGAWALELVPQDGVIHLLAVVDDEMLENMRLLGQPFRAAEMDEALLAGLGQPEVAGLVAVMQRRAAEAGVDCRVTVRHGDMISAVTEFANSTPHLVIIGCGSALGDFQRALSLVRDSVNPVLVV